MIYYGKHFGTIPKTMELINYRWKNYGPIPKTIVLHRKNYGPIVNYT